MIFAAIHLSSCGEDLSKYGDVKFYDNGKTFSFVVSDSFGKKSHKSPRYKNNSKITKAEMELLNAILLSKNLCLKEELNKPSFVITAKQEKIYDVTYASLIEQNYNAKSVAPTTYFGKCY